MQPEKIVVFAPIVIMFVIMGGLILGFLALVGKLVYKGRKLAWKGTLIDKLHKTGEDMDSGKTQHFNTLVFKTEEGKELKVGTSKDVFDTYNVGDKAEKKSGEFWPKKINQ